MLSRSAVADILPLFAVCTGFFFFSDTKGCVALFGVFPLSYRCKIDPTATAGFIIIAQESICTTP